MIVGEHINGPPPLTLSDNRRLYTMAGHFRWRAPLLLPAHAIWRIIPRISAVCPASDHRDKMFLSLLVSF